MGLINELDKKSLFVDTAPIIYYIEGHSQYQQRLAALFEANDKGIIQFHTSTLTLLELLVQPLRKGYSALVDQYREIMAHSPNLLIHELDLDTSVRAARLRASFNLQTPDAIQIATAMENEVDYFLTNDKKLTKVEEIAVLTLADL